MVDGPRPRNYSLDKLLKSFSIRHTWVEIFTFMMSDVSLSTAARFLVVGGPVIVKIVGKNSSKKTKMMTKGNEEDDPQKRRLAHHWFTSQRPQQKVSESKCFTNIICPIRMRTNKKGSNTLIGPQLITDLNF